MSEPRRVLLVDDESLARTNMRHALAAIPRWTVVAEASSAAEARQALAASPVDVVLLDVQMPGETGLTLARELSRQDEPPLIVFVTAYEGYALDAFELHALDYLLKPLDDARLAQAVARAEELLGLRERASYASALRDYLADVGSDGRPREAAALTRFSVRSVGKIESIAVADVVWIAAAGNYVELHLGHRVVLHRVTLAALERRLDPATFLRVHRGTIVRRADLGTLSVTGDGTYMLRLRSGARVAVSERYVDAVRAAMAP